MAGRPARSVRQSKVDGHHAPTLEPVPVTRVDHDTYVSFMLVLFTTKRITKTTASAGRHSVRAR